MKDFFTRGWGLLSLIAFVLFPGLSMPIDFWYAPGPLPHPLAMMTHPFTAIPWLLLMNYMDWLTTDFLVERMGPDIERNIIWRRYFRRNGRDRRSAIMKLAIFPMGLIVIPFMSPGMSFAAIVLSSIAVAFNYVQICKYIRQHGVHPPAEDQK